MASHPTQSISHDTIWNPELLLVSWLSAAFVLMTLSLLFYHMVRVASLEMSSSVSSIFAVCLILCSVVLTCAAVFVYDRRTQDIGTVDLATASNELRFKRFWTIICVCIIFIQLMIAFTIAYGALRTYQARRK